MFINAFRISTVSIDIIWTHYHERIVHVEPKKKSVFKKYHSNNSGHINDPHIKVLFYILSNYEPQFISSSNCNDTSVKEICLPDLDHVILRNPEESPYN